jgi:hypothetical protein
MLQSPFKRLWTLLGEQLVDEIELRHEADNENMASFKKYAGKK